MRLNTSSPDTCAYKYKTFVVFFTENVVGPFTVLERNFFGNTVDSRRQHFLVRTFHYFSKSSSKDLYILNKLQHGSDFLTSSFWGDFCSPLFIGLFASILICSLLVVASYIAFVPFSLALTASYSSWFFYLKVLLHALVLLTGFLKSHLIAIYDRVLRWVWQIDKPIEKLTDGRLKNQEHLQSMYSPLTIICMKLCTWWLIDCVPDFWGRGPGFASGIFHDDPDALQDHCVIM